MAEAIGLARAPSPVMSLRGITFFRRNPIARSIVKATTRTDMIPIGIISGPPFKIMSNQLIDGIGAAAGVDFLSNFVADSASEAASA